MTYEEILQAAQNDALRRKIRVAIIVAAEEIRTESETTPNHAERLVWARAAFTEPQVLTERMVWAVLAQNRAASLNVVLTASDAIVQNSVNSAVSVFL